MLVPAIVTKAATLVGVSSSLLFSVCQVETGMTVKNNFGDSHGRGSFGMCQTSVGVARQFRPELDALALQQPSVSLEVAARYLKKLLVKYKGNMRHSIAAYNAGYAFIKDNMYCNNKYVVKVVNVYNTVGEEQL